MGSSGNGFFNFNIDASYELQTGRGGFDWILRDYFGMYWAGKFMFAGVTASSLIAEVWLCVWFLAGSKEFVQPIRVETLILVQSVNSVNLGLSYLGR